LRDYVKEKEKMVKKTLLYSLFISQPCSQKGKKAGAVPKYPSMERAAPPDYTVGKGKKIMSHELLS